MTTLKLAIELVGHILDLDRRKRVFVYLSQPNDPIKMTPHHPLEEFARQPRVANTLVFARVKRLEGRGENTLSRAETINRNPASAQNNSKISTNCLGS